MLGVFRNDSFQERTGFGGFVCAQKTLPKMSARINVLGITLERRAIAGFGFIQLALLEVNVTHLRMMMSFVQVMDLSLEFLDSAAVMGAGQFKPPRRRGRGPVDHKVIK